MLLTNWFPLYNTEIVDIIAGLKYLVVASCVVAFLGYTDVAKKWPLIFLLGKRQNALFVQTGFHLTEDANLGTYLPCDSRERVLFKEWIGFFSLARYENLFAHTVAVMRLYLSKKNNLLLIFTF